MNATRLKSRCSVCLSGNNDYAPTDRDIPLLGEVLECCYCDRLFEVREVFDVHNIQRRVFVLLESREDREDKSSISLLKALGL